MKLQNLTLIFSFMALMLCSIDSQAAPRCRNLMERLPVETAEVTEDQIRDQIQAVKKYQDKSNKEWADTKKCLCCHTTLPYVLSRGIDSKSRSNFDKFQKLAVEKVENPSAQPWYAADYQGRNSKPTEAVMNALTLLMYDSANGQPVKAVTKKAVDRILENLDADGHIHWLDFHLEPFESKNGELWGNSMAVLAVEMAKKNSDYRPNEANYSKLKNYLKEKESDLKPQEMAVMLWADSLNSSVLSSAQRTKFANEILSKQNVDGSWNQSAVLGLGLSQGDAYSTAISIIGLIKSGHGSDDAVKKAVLWLASQQSSRSPFAEWRDEVFWYQASMNRPGSPRNDRFATDFASSYASLALQMYGTGVLNAP